MMAKLQLDFCSLKPPQHIKIFVENMRKFKYALVLSYIKNLWLIYLGNNSIIVIKENFLIFNRWQDILIFRSVTMSASYFKMAKCYQLFHLDVWCMKCIILLFQPILHIYFFFHSTLFDVGANIFYLTVYFLGNCPKKLVIVSKFHQNVSDEIT